LEFSAELEATTFRVEGGQKDAVSLRADDAN
jgi:hypothetical protein